LTDNVNQFEGQVKNIKLQFEKDIADIEHNKTTSVAQEKEKFTKQMQNVKDDIDGVNKLHDQEVQNVFEDEKTLGFIQKMRGFKKGW
jgi:conjugal transfer/entry exclusion protein